MAKVIGGKSHYLDKLSGSKIRWQKSFTKKDYKQQIQFFLILGFFYVPIFRCVMTKLIKMNGVSPECKIDITLKTYTKGFFVFSADIGYPRHSELLLKER